MGPNNNEDVLPQPSEITSLEAAKGSLLRRLHTAGALEVKELQAIVKALADVNAMIEKAAPQGAGGLTIDEQFQMFKREFWSKLSPIDRERYREQL